MMAGLGSPAVRWLGMLMLCAAYIQGPLWKIADFAGAISEMEHFGLRPALLFAVGVILFELIAVIMILSGRGRALAALALGAFTLAATLVALRFWELPAGSPRTMAANAFFEHIGLAGGFLLVASLGRAR